jgi:uncharacterized membrane protein YdjX (TVP38/TMEM64 family)
VTRLAVVRYVSEQAMTEPERAAMERAPRPRGSTTRLVVGVALGLAGAYFLAGPLREMKLGDAGDALREMGPQGILLFLLVFSVVQPLFVSSHLFTFTATLVWGQPLAFVLTWVGSTLAAMTAFGFARYVARDYVQAKLPARFRNLDERLDRSAFRTIFWLRALFWCAPPLGFAAGVSRVNGMTHHLASALGCVPQVFVSSLVAYWLKEALVRGDYSVGSILTAITVLGVLIFGAFLLGRRLLRRPPAPAPRGPGA